MYQDVREKKSSRDAGSLLVQVVDQQKKPLAALSLAQVHRQKLLHQAVYLLAYTTCHRLCLNRSLFRKKECWELPGWALVEAGESVFAAAERLSTEYTGRHFSLIWQAGFFDKSSFQFLDVYRLSFQAGKFFSDSQKQELVLDHLEFERIITDYPAMLGPHVSRLWQQGLLFRD